MKKKISLPIVITIAFIVAAIAFSVAYVIATKSMNAKLTDLGEKQAMFSTLSEVDNFVREKSFYDVDKEVLTAELCKAYADAYDGRILYLTSGEFEESVYATRTDYTVLKLADGNVLVVLTEEQYEAFPEATNAPESDSAAETESEIASAE